MQNTSKFNVIVLGTAGKHLEIDRFYVFLSAERPWL